MEELDLVKVTIIATGIQFPWALQLSLLTPYMQELGIPHRWASSAWLVSPLLMIFLQPFVGYISDQSESKWGRRRPMIVVGALVLSVSVLFVSFATDLGKILGGGNSTVASIVLFMLGFSLLDLANTILQILSRALLGDLTVQDQMGNRKANSYYSLFMAVGNVLGFATGTYTGWYKMFPSTLTDSCAVSCANLKVCCSIAILVLLCTTLLSLSAAREVPWVNPRRRPEPQPEPTHTTPLLQHVQVALDPEEEGQEKVEESGPEDDVPHFVRMIIQTLVSLPRRMWALLFVIFLNWASLFPFLVFDTDWMGREFYTGDPSGDEEDVARYYKGVHLGAFGLMLNSIVWGMTALSMEYLCKKMGTVTLWSLSNVIAALCLGSTWLITVAAKAGAAAGVTDPPPALIFAALTLFAILGIPLATTFIVPYSLTASYSSPTRGGGLGLVMGLVTLAISIPEIFISSGSGNWDEHFGGGNLPAFKTSALVALVAAMAASFLLPEP